MAQDGGTVMSEESRLTKSDVAPPCADLSVVSALTGEIRESKAKAYAAEESKKVAAQYIGTIENLNTKFKYSDKKVENLQPQLELALKALAEATSKFNLDPQANEESALSSNLSRSSDSVKCVGSKSPTSNIDSSMIDGISNVESNDDNYDDDDDDGSDRLSKANNTAGQGSKELSSTSPNYNNTLCPASPFRKNKDCKETFVRDEESVKTRSPKTIKTITPDKYGRRSSNRLKPPSLPIKNPIPRIKETALITEDGDGVSL